MPTTTGLWLPPQRQARQRRGKTSAFAPRKSPFGARISKFSRKPTLRDTKMENKTPDRWITINFYFNPELIEKIMTS